MPFTQHPIFVGPNPDQVIWRYMDFAKFYDLVTRKTLYLSSLESLTSDPWEGLPPKKYFDPLRKVRVNTVESKSTLDLRNIESSQIMTQQEFFKRKDKFDSYVQNSVKSLRESKKNIFVNCWHMNDIESEALWKIYSGKEYGICIRSTYKKLSDALEYSKIIYSGKVIYLDELTELHGDDNIYYNCNWKRKSFEYENELRVIIHDEENNSSGVRIPIDINCLIDEIIVCPDAKDWFLENVQHLGRSVGCYNCVRSNLLSEPNFIE